MIIKVIDIFFHRKTFWDIRFFKINYYEVFRIGLDSGTLWMCLFDRYHSIDLYEVKDEN